MVAINFRNEKQLFQLFSNSIFYAISQPNWHYGICTTKHFITFNICCYQYCHDIIHSASFVIPVTLDHSEATTTTPATSTVVL